VLSGGYLPQTGSVLDYAVGTRTAYNLGAKGWTFEQVQKHGGEDVAKLTEQQLRHAWQLGANAQTAEAVTVDVNTQEGRTALEAKFRPLGAYSDMAVNAYEAGQDTSIYSDAMTKAATLFSVGADVENIVQQAREGNAVDNMAKLSAAQVQVAKQIGEKLRADKVKAVEAKETLLSELRKNAQGKGPTPGKVTIETTDGEAAGLKYTAVDASKLSDTQQGVVKLADAIARYSGLDIRVVDFGKGYGGEYLPGKGGKLYVNINASWNGQNVAAGSLTHEVTHFLQEYAPKRYGELKQIVMEEMSKNPETFADILGARAGAQPNLTVEGLTDEMVANACQTIFMDPEAVQRIANSNPTLFEKLRDWVLKVIDDLKAAFAEFHTDSSFPLMKEVKAAEGALDKMREAWMSALSEASENLQAEKATGDTAWRAAQEVFTEHPTEVGTYDMEDFTDAKTPDGEELFQIYAFEHDEPEYREMLAKWGGLTSEQIDELFRTVDMAMAKIKANLEALDYAWEADIDDRAFNPIKQNSDKLYKVSLDFSTLCRKRLL
ncbi:MAG: hypothetical protein IKX75_07705, partial [Desulfovibrio sp.]|nr:hypothetical protein [Desulfovibrio sp.]